MKLRRILPWFCCLAVAAAAGCQCDEDELAGVFPVMTVECSGEACDGYDFGEVPVGVTREATLELTNTGDTDLHISSMGLQNGKVFAIDPLDSLSGFAEGKVTVNPTKSVQFKVTFKPVTPAPPADSDVIAFDTNDPKKKSYEFSLKGTGIKASITADPAAIDFGKVDVKTRKDVAVSVSNTGSDVLKVTSVAYVDAAGGGDIFIDGGPPEGQDLEPGAAIDFTLSYLPTDIGADSGEIRVENDSKDLPHLTIAVNGLGIAPLLVVSPLTLDFGSVDKGSQHDLSTTLTNNGNKDLDVAVVEFRQGTSDYYSFVTPLQTPATVEPAKSVDITVRYHPLERSDDTLNNSVRIHCNDPALPEMDPDGNYVTYVELKGRTHAPSMEATGGTSFQIGCGMPFDPQNPGCNQTCIADCCCMEATLDVENVGDDVLILESVTMIENTGNAFTLLWNEPVPYQIDPGVLEPIWVRFTPLTFGTFNAKVEVVSNDPITPTRQIGIAGSAVKRQ
ncbi:MAG: choice-of-anchor D domain-containing protein [Deltaproteobacteria bacterium]|nr:choice-of-anchor D domain-containing protein [Deltaproteobacteria bacterium]